MIKIPEKYRTVTTFSKCAALALFVMLPLIGFVVGMNYQKTLSSATTANTDSPDMGYPKQMIIVDYPQPNDVISNPLTVTGKARGNWFFEGDFPVTLYCGTIDGPILVQYYATAQGEWTTEDFVEFSSTLEFPMICQETGFLELRRNNPSGLPNHNDKVYIPVRFD